MKTTFTILLLTIFFSCKSQYIYMVNGSRPIVMDTLIMKTGETRQVIFVMEKGDRIMLQGKTKPEWIKKDGVLKLSLSTGYRKDIFFKAIGDAGKFGIGAVIAGVIGGTMAGIGASKNIPGLTYGGIAVAGVALPLSILSLGNLTRASNHRF